MGTPSTSCKTEKLWPKLSSNLTSDFTGTSGSGSIPFNLNGYKWPDEREKAIKQFK
jgi:hypothetical protein